MITILCGLWRNITQSYKYKGLRTVLNKTQWLLLWQRKKTSKYSVSKNRLWSWTKLTKQLYKWCENWVSYTTIWEAYIPIKLMNSGEELWVSVVFWLHPEPSQYKGSFRVDQVVRTSSLISLFKEEFPNPWPIDWYQYHVLLETRPHSRRWALGEQAKLLLICSCSP